MSNHSQTISQSPRYAWQLFWMYMPVLFLLSPFALHQSSEPLWLCYSSHYALFLVSLALTGLGLSAFLLWIVRHAPPYRRLSFAYLLLGGIVGFVASTEIVWGIVEGDAFSGYHTWGQQRSPFVGFENIPDYAQQTLQGHVTFDAHGFRDHLSPRVPVQNEQLIVVMGGSSAFGFGLDDEETWPMELQRQLRSKYGDNITVLNAANRGHNSMQQLIRLYQRVLPLKPSVVIYYGAWNDLNSQGQPTYMPWLSSTLAQSSSARHYLRLRNKGSGLYWENSFILDRLCQVARRISPAITASRDKSVHTRHETKAGSYEAAAKLFVRNIDAMNMFCQRDNVLFIPICYVADDNNLKPRDRKGLHVLVGALRTYCQKNSLYFIDVESAFSDIADRSIMFQSDHYHPTALGAKFIGAQVAESVGASLYPTASTLVTFR